jgi:hypothetical protein
MGSKLKRWLGRVLLAGWGVALLAPDAASALSISLLVDGDTSATVAVGGVLEVDVFVSGLTAGGAPSLKSFEIDLTFDDSVLAFQSASFGTALNGGNPASSFQDSGLRAVAQAFIAEVSILGNLNFQSDAFLLGTLFFDVIAGGNAVVALGTNAAPVSPLFGDQNGDPLLLGAVPAPIAVEAIPEPGTLLLVGAGLVALAVRRRPSISRRKGLASRYRAS